MKTPRYEINVCGDDINNRKEYEYEYLFEYAHNTVIIRIQKNFIQLIKEGLFSEDKDENEDFMFYEKATLLNAAEKAMLLHIFLYNLGIKILVARCYRITQDGKTIDRQSNWIKSMIEGELSDKLPDFFSQASKPGEPLANYILGMRRNTSEVMAYGFIHDPMTDKKLDTLPASLYAYLFAKSRTTEFEKFFYNWMALASLMLWSQSKNKKTNKGDKSVNNYLSALSGGSDASALRGYAKKHELLKGRREDLLNGECDKAVYLCQQFFYVLFMDASDISAEDFCDLPTLLCKLKKGINNKKAIDYYKRQERVYKKVLLGASEIANYIRRMEPVIKSDFNGSSGKEEETDYDKVMKGFKMAFGSVEGPIDVCVFSRTKSEKVIAKDELFKIIEEDIASQLKNDDVDDRDYYEKLLKIIKEVKRDFEMAQAFLSMKTWKERLENYEDEDNMRAMIRFFLLDLPYFYRCKYFHTQMLLPIFECPETEILGGLGNILEKWLDEKLCAAIVEK